MARIRTIKPGFFRSDDVTPLTYRARITWVGLWTYVDDEGRGRDNARIIKGELWTLEDDMTHVEVEEDLDELDRNDRISRYEVDGKRFLVINKWLDHQVISRPTPSRFPEPTEENMQLHVPLTESSVSAQRVDTAGSGRGKGSGRGTGNREVSLTATTDSTRIDDLFDEAWTHWPKKVNKEPSRVKFKAACRKVAPEVLADDIARFGDAYASTTTKQFTPGLNVWLGNGRWTDELPTADVADRKPTRTDQNLDFVRQLAREEQQTQQRGITA